MALYLGTQKVKINLGGGKKHAFLGRPDHLILDGKLVFADPKVYLLSDSTAGTYINTRLRAQNFSQIECTYQVVGTSPAYACVFGGRVGAGDCEIEWRKMANPSRWKFGYGSQALFYADAATMFDKHTVRYDDGVVYFDGESVITGVSESAFEGMRQVYLFALNDHGLVNTDAKAACKIYRIRFAVNDEWVRDFVPVPAGLVIGNFTVPAAGMFDTINQQFFGNSGDGSFIYGKDN